MYSVLFEYLENFYTIHQVKCTQIVLCTNLLHLWIEIKIWVGADPGNFSPAFSKCFRTNIPLIEGINSFQKFFHLLSQCIILKLPPVIGYF